MQRRLPDAIDGVYVGAELQQQFNDVDVILVHGSVQRRQQVLVLPVEVGRVLAQQELRHLQSYDNKRDGLLNL